MYANPCLWDKNDPHYDNNSTRINVFMSIGKEINRSGSDVSKIWQALREKYIREKIKLNENTGRHWNSTRRWEFFDCLAFVHLGMDEQHQAIVGSLSVQVNDKSYFEEVFNAAEKALVRPKILGNDDKSSVPRSQIKAGIKHSSASVASVYIPTQEPRMRFKRETDDYLPETSFSSSRPEDENEAIDPLDNNESGSKKRKKVGTSESEEMISNFMNRFLEARKPKNICIAYTEYLASQMNLWSLEKQNKFISKVNNLIQEINSEDEAG